MSIVPRPVVSVCIPVYNGEPYIGRAIESVLDQTLADFELVVVDNASTDRTLEIVSGFSDTRLRVIRNPENIGAAANWNRALELAQGGYFKLLCADDWLYPTCLERQVAALAADESRRVAIVCCGRDVVGQSGRRLATRSFGRAGVVGGCTAVRRIVRSGTNPIGEPAAVLTRTDWAREVGGFERDGTYVIDVDLWIRLLARGGLCAIEEPLAAFRLAPGSWSSTVAGRQAADYRQLLARIDAGRFGLSAVDILSGSVMASLNAIGRRVFYMLTPLGARDSG
jgi:glycosyltransferase involved in cell wall biosynthesis